MLRLTTGVRRRPSLEETVGRSTIIDLPKFQIPLSQSLGVEEVVARYS